MHMNLKELRSFIHSASKATYASGDESIKVKQSDGSTTIQFTHGEYTFHDNYFGGEPYGGREVVFQHGKPVWMMVYYGAVVPEVPHREVYAFLIDSLAHATEEVPFRGLDGYTRDNWRYEFVIEGGIEHLAGKENIFKGDMCVYTAQFLGGLVDQS